MTLSVQTGAVDLEFVTLASLAHGAHVDAVIERLARWHVEQWGSLYDPEVWNLDVARREFRQDLETPSGELPVTILARSTESAGPDALRGSVSLVPSDDLEGHEHLGPWLASLYVPTEYRGRGVGGRLVDEALATARRYGIDTLHLFTVDHQDWYRHRGFDAVATTWTGPRRHQVTVMACRLVGAT